MRILHVLDHSLPLHSGYTFRTASILRQQRRLGWETVHLTSPKQANCTALEEDVDGLHFYRTPPPNKALSRVPLLAEWQLMQATTRRLMRLAQELEPDLLHAHSPVLNAFPALQVGRRLNIPVVYEIRAFWEDAAVDLGTQREWGPRYRVTRLLETRAVRRAHQVVTICKGLQEDLAARGIPLDKLHVVPNAVDVSAFSHEGLPDEGLKASLGLEGARVIGFLGSFYAYEGLDLLINAMPDILKEAPDVRVLLVGGGPQETNLKALAHSLGLDEKVVFVGRVPHEVVSRYYDLVDLLAYPRHSMRLTDLVTPLKPLEAMAQGRLLIASDVGGHRELIADGRTGILFPAGDSAALATRAVEVLNLPDKGEAIRREARRYVETERTWARSVERYREVYSAALGRPV